MNLEQALAANQEAETLNVQEQPVSEKEAKPEKEAEKKAKKKTSPYDRLAPRDYKLAQSKKEKGGETETLKNKAAEDKNIDIKDKVVEREIITKGGVPVEKVTEYDTLSDTSRSYERELTPKEWQLNLNSLELKQEKTLTKFDDVEQLAESYVNLEKKVSEAGKLKDDATVEEQIEAASKYFSVPGAKDYEQSDALKDLSDMEKQVVTEIGMDHGIPPEIARSIHNSYDEATEEAVLTAQHEMFNQSQDYDKQLAAEYGSDLREVRRQVVEGCAAAGIDYEKLTPMEKRLPALISVAAELAKTRSDASSISENVPAPVKQEKVARMSPEEVDARITTLVNDPAFIDSDHPNHRFIRKDYYKLLEVKHPENKDEF